jgi:glycine/D-amino acid oxidase-like deaminating enzyme
MTHAAAAQTATGSKKNVIVIGAGIAGLSCGYELISGTRAEAIGNYAGAAGQSFGGDPTQAERRIDALVLPQTGGATGNQQRHCAAHLAASRVETASLGTLHGQR